MNDRRGSFLVKLGIILFLVEINHGQVPRRGGVRDCSIVINGDLGEPQPLILHPNIAMRGQNTFLYPMNGLRKLVIPANRKFRIACPGSKLNLNSVKSFTEATVQCLGNDNFYIVEAKIRKRFQDISCVQRTTPVMRPANDACQGGNSFEIGFSLQPKTVGKRRVDEFQRLIDLCHDKTLGHTIYAHAKILAVADAVQKGFPRTPFRKGILFPRISPENAYKRITQRETIGRLLDSKKLAEKYISVGGPSPNKQTQNFLARGHLIAKTDFIYGSQQLATFYFANSVPMWHSINSGNWQIMEKNVRDYAVNMKLDLDIWVGTIGIMTLENEKNQMRDIYLYVDGTKKAIPVPKILFKVVYSRTNEAGIVFVTANNPFMDKLTPDYEICKNSVCNMIRYLTWNPNDREGGFSYCCTIQDFRKVYPNLPPFRTTQLLI